MILMEFQVSDRGLFQCASYAISEAMRNIKLHQQKPIYLFLSSNSHWYFATLIVRSTVRIGDDGLLEDAPSEDKDALDARLGEKLETIQFFSSSKVMDYEPGRYAIGEMYICSEVSIIFNFIIFALLDLFLITFVF
jgi:hypothetical protein